jgi:hypothetical protein
VFNYDEWVNNHEHIYNMGGAVWQDQKAFGRIAVEAALKNAESATTGLQQLKAEIAAIANEMDVLTNEGKRVSVLFYVDKLRQLSAV